jgi:NDP-sugar pyrophosphorylase family protein
LQHASKLLEDHFFLINGDSFLDCPYDQMWTAFCTLSKGCDAMVSAFARLSEVPVPGNLKLAKESGEQDQPVRRVTAYQANGGLERGYTSVDSGVYIIKSTALQTVWSEGSWPLSRLWAQLINKETFWSFEHENRFFDIGTPERLAEFGNHLKGKKS